MRFIYENIYGSAFMINHICLIIRIANQFLYESKSISSWLVFFFFFFLKKKKKKHLTHLKWWRQWLRVTGKWEGQMALLLLHFHRRCFEFRIQTPFIARHLLYLFILSILREKLDPSLIIPSAWYLTN